MCDYKTLYIGEDGYAVSCAGCGHIHLAFGNTLLAFREPQFHQFVKAVDDRYFAERHSGCRQEKRVQLGTDAASVMLVFSVEELERYRSLLAKASDRLLREKLFQFNDN